MKLLNIDVLCSLAAIIAMFTTPALAKHASKGMDHESGTMLEAKPKEDTCHKFDATKGYREEVDTSNCIACVMARGSYGGGGLKHGCVYRMQIVGNDVCEQRRAKHNKVDTNVNEDFAIDATACDKYFDKDALRHMGNKYMLNEGVDDIPDLFVDYFTLDLVEDPVYFSITPDGQDNTKDGLLHTTVGRANLFKAWKASKRVFNPIGNVEYINAAIFDSSLVSTYYEQNFLASNVALKEKIGEWMKKNATRYVEEERTGSYLQVLSGHANIDASRNTLWYWNQHDDESFASVRLAGIHIPISGKWYYEIVLPTDTPRIAIGWVDDKFRVADPGTLGVGNDKHSFAYNLLHYKKAYNGNFSKYGPQSRQWKTGDIIGCMLDMGSRTIRFSINGKDYGPAFKNIKISGAVYPAVSFNQFQEIQLHVYTNELKYLPDGYKSVLQ